MGLDNISKCRIFINLRGSFQSFQAVATRLQTRDLETPTRSRPMCTQRSLADSHQRGPNFISSRLADSGEQIGNKVDGSRLQPSLIALGGSKTQGNPTKRVPQEQWCPPVLTHDPQMKPRLPPKRWGQDIRALRSIWQTSAWNFGAAVAIRQLRLLLCPLTMPGEDVASSPSRGPRASQLTPLLVSPNLAIVLQPATPTTPPNTPPVPPINPSLLSPPSLKRRPLSNSEAGPTTPPPRPASAPPRFASFNQPNRPPATPPDSPPWYLSGNSLTARRSGRTVTVPPPPLGQYLLIPVITYLTHHSSAHHLLAESKQIRGVRPLLFALVSPHPSVFIHCRWSRSRQAFRRSIRVRRRIKSPPSQPRRLPEVCTRCVWVASPSKYSSALDGLWR